MGSSILGAHSSSIVYLSSQVHWLSRAAWNSSYLIAAITSTGKLVMWLLGAKHLLLIYFPFCKNVQLLGSSHVSAPYLNQLGPSVVLRQFHQSYTMCRGQQGGLECPGPALASCLPSFLNDQQQVEWANRESNKPPRSCPPFSEQSLPALYLGRTWRDVLSWAVCRCGVPGLPGELQSSCPT